MSTVYVGTGKPSFWVKNSSGDTVVQINASDISYEPVYNRVYRKKREESYIMADGTEKRFCSGTQIYGEIYYDAGMLSQAVIDKFDEIDYYDTINGYTCYIKPRSDASLEGKCIIDISFAYRDDKTNSGVEVVINWRFSDLI